MSDLLFQPMPQTEAEYVATIKQLFVEMQQLNEKMQHDQADIDRLKAELPGYIIAEGPAGNKSFSGITEARHKQTTNVI